MDKKTKTTSNTTQDATMSGTSSTTPNTPSWYSDLTQNLGGQIGGVKSTVSPLTGLQQDAVGGLQNQNFGGLFGDAANLAKQGAQSLDDYNPSALGGVQSWLNPFLGGVVDATTADLDANDARTRAQQDLSIAGNGAFGGSGAALTKSLTEGELERARGTTLGGLRMGAFDSAAGNAQQDSSRALQAAIAKAAAQSGAAGQLAGIGSQGIGLQADLGEQQRQIDQSSANSGITDLLTKLGLFGQLPTDFGQTTTQSGSTSQTGTGTSTSKTSDPLGQLSTLLASLPKAPIPPG